MSGIDLNHFFSGSKKWSFTLELGRGETLTAHTKGTQCLLGVHSEYSLTPGIVSKKLRLN